MDPEEALIEAIKAGDYESLEDLIDELGCTVSDALQYAVEHGFSEAVETLLPEFIGDGEYYLDDDVLSDLDSMAVIAAGNGHFEVVGQLLSEVQMERLQEGKFVYYGYERDHEESQNDAAWHVLDVATEHGHVDIVNLAVGSVSDDEYMPAGERSNALSCAISGGYAGVVKLLLECEHLHWDIRGAFEQAVGEKQHDITELISQRTQTN